MILVQVRTLFTHTYVQMFELHFCVQTRSRANQHHARTQTDRQTDAHWVTGKSNGDDTRELLDAVEERIALLDGLLVKSILVVGPIAPHNTLDLVNLELQMSHEQPCHESNDAQRAQFVLKRH